MLRSLLALAGASLLTSTSSTIAAEIWIDQAHNYSVEIPRRWVSVSPDVITTLNHNIGKYLRQDVRYRTCLVPAGKTSAELPRILVQFQEWEDGIPTYEALEESLKNDVAPAIKKVQKESAIPISSTEVGESRLDRETNRMYMRMRASVPGDGMVDGLSIGLLGKRGIVFLHCYGKSDKFAKMIPFFGVVADSVKFDPGHEYKPEDATRESLAPRQQSADSEVAGFSLTGATRGGLIGAGVGGALGAIALVARSMRKRATQTPAT